MDIKNLVMAVVGMVLAAVMIGGAFIPAVAGGLVTAGSPIELENTKGNGLPNNYDAITGNYIIEIVINDDNTFTINANGVDIPKTISYQTLVMSDVMTAEIVSSSSAIDVASIILFGETYNENIRITINSVGTHTITFNNGTYSVISGSNTYTGAFNWAYGIMTGGKYIIATTLSTWYVDSINDIVMCRNDTSGSLVCSYTFYNGDLWNNGGFEDTVNFETGIADGTTNIKQVTKFSITLSNGEISEDIPIQRALIKESVKGNANSGGAYAMLSVLPLVAVAGLVMAGIYVFISRK